MVEAAVQSEAFRGEGQYVNSDGLPYNAEELRQHSWAYWFNQANHNTSAVFTEVRNSYNPGDTVLTGAMRYADWDKSVLPLRLKMHHNRTNLDPLLFLTFPPYPLRSLTGTTNAANPNPPPANLTDSGWYALYQVPALMQTRQELYDYSHLQLPIGANAPADVPNNWVMNDASQQGWAQGAFDVTRLQLQLVGHSDAWKQPFNVLNVWWTQFVKPGIQPGKW